MKLINAEEASKLIRDNDRLGVSNFVSLSLPEDIFVSLEERFLKEGHPKNLSVMHVSGVGNFDSMGLSHLAHDGMVKRVYGAHEHPAPKILPMLDDGRIEAYLVPQGVCCHLLRAMAGGEDGLLTKIGLNTYADPRQDGCRMNASCTEDVVELVNVCGKELLYYKAQPLDVCILKATFADEEGNIAFDWEPALLEQREMAEAVKRNGGTVIVQVHKLVKKGTLDPWKVKIPGAFVDYVVVGRPENTFQSAGWKEIRPELTGQARIPVESVEPMEFNLRKVAGRRGAMEIRPDTLVNIGIGMSEAVANVAAEEGLSEQINLAVESGSIGGVPVPGAIGNAYNPIMIMSQPECFDMYNGGALDISFLGSGEVDQEGNVNVTKFGGKVIGPGGFVNISQNTKKVCFLSTFMVGKVDAELGNGKLSIKKDGKKPKFVKRVEQITFSAKNALENGQEILYITERAVFVLTPKGIMLTEIAPGVDLQKDILDKMDFKPQVADEIKIMDERIFHEEKMGLTISQKEKRT
ncbi:MAG: 3-oxoacid CoA-transferase [Lachnospiraceae bacterium]|nr:3-oxoacid CoA-transferase [Lachnospiraceae bacterium]